MIKDIDVAELFYQKKKAQGYLEGRYIVSFEVGFEKKYEVTEKDIKGVIDEIPGLYPTSIRFEKKELIEAKKETVECTK